MLNPGPRFSAAAVHRMSLRLFPAVADVCAQQGTLHPRVALLQHEISSCARLGLFGLLGLRKSTDSRLVSMENMEAHQSLAYEATALYML